MKEDEENMSEEVDGESNKGIEERVLWFHVPTIGRALRVIATPSPSCLVQLVPGSS